MAKSLLKLVGSAVLCLGFGGASGCGSGVISAPDVTPLRGNWLIAGTLPEFGLASFPPKFGLAMSIDMFSGVITGGASLMVPCTSGQFTGAVGGATKFEVATPNNDGTFMLEDVLLGGQTTHQFVVHGTLPKTPGGAWSGTFTVSAPNAGCTPISGDFTETPVQQLTGTYKATGTLTGSNAPVTLSISLEQGGPQSLNVPGASITSENAIGGTIEVQGSPCFTSGTVALNHGALYGNTLGVPFTMNDGSTLFFTANVDNTLSSALNGRALVSGGNCDKNFLSSTFLRQ